MHLSCWIHNFTEFQKWYIGRIFWVYLNWEPAHLVSVLANQVYPLHFPLHNTTPNIPANEESSKSVIFWLKLLKVKAWNRKMKNDNTANSNDMKQCPRFATELFSIGLYWPKDISPGSCFLVFISMWARKFVDKRVLKGKGLDQYRINDSIIYPLMDMLLSWCLIQYQMVYVPTWNVESLSLDKLPYLVVPKQVWNTGGVLTGLPAPTICAEKLTSYHSLWLTYSVLTGVLAPIIGTEKFNSYHSLWLSYSKL